MTGKYFLGWFPMMVLAVLNGGLRDLLYGPLINELAAHQLSTAILLLVLSGYYWLLLGIWPLKTIGEAWMIGLLWLVMTLTFESLLVRVVQGNSWEILLYDYNLLAGRVWLLVPLWTLLAPPLLFRLKHSS